MDIIDRNYVLMDFTYEGTFDVQRGLSPTLEIGFFMEKEIPNIQPLKAHIEYILRANNFDASLVFYLHSTTNIASHAFLLNENEIWDEMVLVCQDAFKLCIQECTSARKYTYPKEPDINLMKERLLPVITTEIDRIIRHS